MRIQKNIIENTLSNCIKEMWDEIRINDIRNDYLRQTIIRMEKLQTVVVEALIKMENEQKEPVKTILSEIESLNS
jgi:hypothetical protein